MKNAPPRPPFLLAWDEAIKYVGTFVQLAITRASFYYTKQPARIKQVGGEDHLLLSLLLLLLVVVVVYNGRACRA